MKHETPRTNAAVVELHNPHDGWGKYVPEAVSSALESELKECEMDKKLFQKRLEKALTSIDELNDRIINGDDLKIDAALATEDTKGEG